MNKEENENREEKPKKTQWRIPWRTITFIVLWFITDWGFIVSEEARPYYLATMAIILAYDFILNGGIPK